jgi:Uma2 family endonuclease
MSASATRYEDIPVRPDGFTVADLDLTPDDGRRYELVEGMLIVSPKPKGEHQYACGQLSTALEAACPDDMVVFAPTPNIIGGPRTSVRPDLCVVRGYDLAPDKPYEGVPVLTVEVLSPSSVNIDRLLKRHVYAELGMPSYWIVDLDVPSVTVLGLAAGSYVEEAIFTDDEPLTVAEPFPVTVRPSDLVR